MIRLALSYLLVLWAAEATAQTAEVRTGEHADFTRLVLSIPPGAPWSLGRESGGYLLDLDGAVEAFDTSAAFERIPRDRLADIQPDGARLSLVLNCDPCHAQAFLWRDDRLVIDIVDGPAPASSQFEVSVSDTPQADPVLPLFTNTPQSAVPLPALPDMLQSAETRDASLSVAEAALLESLGRAASQGLLTPTLDQENQTSPGGLSPMTLSEVGEEDDPRAELGIAVRNGLDIRATGTAPPDTTPDGQTCLSPEKADVAAWAGDSTFEAELGAQRQLLFGEFDILSGDAADALARLYIHYGFGREAMQVLSLDGVQSADRLILLEMAMIVDGGTVPDGLLAAQIGCDNDLALWAALARDTLQSADQMPARNAILQGYQSLPAPLSGHLGIALADRFLSIGDTEAAERVLRQAEGAVTGDTVDADLAAAEISARDGDHRAALSQLEDLSEGSSRLTAEGVIELLALATEQDHPIPEDLFTLADSLRFEAGKSEVTTDLAVAQITARTETGSYDQALTLLDSIRADLPEPTFHTLRAAAISALVREAPDSAFLSKAFGPFPPDLEASTQNEIATRLLSLGFPDQAMTYLQTPARQESAREQRYLRAEAAVATGDSDAALSLLQGMSDPRASQIKALALAQKGDHGGVLANALAATMDPSDAVADATLAWRAGAWSRLSNSEDPLLRDASQAMLAPSTRSREASLSASRELLDQADATRQMTRDLLNRFSVSDQISTD